MNLLIQDYYEFRAGKEKSDQFFKSELENCKTKMSAFTNTAIPAQQPVIAAPQPQSNVNTPTDIPTYKSQAYLDRLDHCIIVANAAQYLATGTSSYGDLGTPGEANTYSSKWDLQAEAYAKHHNLRRVNQNGQENADFFALVTNGGTAVVKSEFSSCKADLG